MFFFFFSSRRRHTRWPRDWSSDVCSSDLIFSRLLLSPASKASKDVRKSSVNFLAITEPAGPVPTTIRSEERRVGKECRYRRKGDDERKKSVKVIEHGDRKK